MAKYNFSRFFCRFFLTFPLFLYFFLAFLIGFRWFVVLVEVAGYSGRSRGLLWSRLRSGITAAAGLLGVEVSVAAGLLGVEVSVALSHLARGLCRMAFPV